MLYVQCTFIVYIVFLSILCFFFYSLQDSHIACYINVMSWSRVGLPLRSDAPIPLYGGMQVPFNDKSCINMKQKPIVFAVMANPEILKKNGKTAENLQVSLLI